MDQFLGIIGGNANAVGIETSLNTVSSALGTLNTEATDQGTTLDNILLELQAGGGTSILAGLVTHMTPKDGAVTYTSSATITCSGFPFTVEDANCVVAFVGVKASAGSEYDFYSNGVNGIAFSSAANVITIAGETPFAAGDSYILGLIEQKKAYDSINKVLNVAESNPADQKKDTEKFTFSSETKSEYVSMDGYGDVSFDMDIASGSFTLQVSNDNETTQTAIATWHDVTGFVGATSPTFATASSMNNCEWIRIVTTAAATATIYVKKKQ